MGGVQVEAFVQDLWSKFRRIAPAASSIRASLEARGERIVDDHVAFRTFDRGPLRLERLEPFLLNLGWERFEPYTFEQKKLRAMGYVHPAPSVPRVFLSELETERCSPRLQRWVDRCVGQVQREPDSARVFHGGRAWSPLPYEGYRELSEESEYAAWVAAFGLCPNHFTVSLRDLSPSLQSVPAMLTFVESLGFSINDAGGRVKGSPEVLLEQGSTLADLVSVAFEDRSAQVPGGYYEFALRHPDDQGRLYPGFVPQSADRIFESTDRRRSPEETEVRPSAGSDQNAGSSSVP